jgi:hypothetical protein
MECKDELKKLSKTSLTSEQAQLLEGVLSIVPEDQRSWVACLIKDGLKERANKYDKAWMGALLTAIAFLVLLGIGAAFYRFYLID